MSDDRRSPLPEARESLAAERRRLERELAATRSRLARRLLAIRRRRVLIAEDAAETAIAARAIAEELLERARGAAA
jgi:hypothetical protein